MRVLLTHCPSQAVRWCGAWSRESGLGRGDPGSAADEGQWAHSSHGAVYGIDLPCVSVFKEGKKVRFGIYKFTKKNKRLKTLSPWVWNKNSVISFYIQAKQEIKTKSCFESRPLPARAGCRTICLQLSFKPTGFVNETGKKIQFPHKSALTSSQ